MDKLVGMGAPADFVRELESLANTHHEKAFLDVMRAYHFGARCTLQLAAFAARLVPPAVRANMLLDAVCDMRQLRAPNGI